MNESKPKRGMTDNTQSDVVEALSKATSPAEAWHLVINNRAALASLSTKDDDLVGAWSQGVDGNGRAYLQDEDFTYDVRLYVDGDFPSEVSRARYVDRILTALRSDRDAVVEEASKAIERAADDYGTGQPLAFIMGMNHAAGIVRNLKGDR